MTTSAQAPQAHHSALLIIDVQQAMFKKSAPVYQSERMLANILSLAAKAREAGSPVVWVQHGDARDLVPDTPGWQLHPALAPQEADLKLRKQKSNAFECTGLRGMLEQRGVNSVVVCGMVTHGCVKNTCLGALEEGWQVTLAADAHSSYSKDAAAMIEKWNAALAEAGVSVVESALISF